MVIGSAGASPSRLICKCLMWQANLERVDDKTHRYHVRDQNDPLSYEAVIGLWQSSCDFRTWFTRLLTDSPFPAFRWETPPLTTATVSRDFEFVLLRADALARPIDPTAFASHFATAGGNDVVSFTNLGGDATLIVPAPAGDNSAHGHLAAFLRGAPAEQADRLWQEVSRCLQDRLADAPVWCSTAGMGVSWLHVRLDSRPKYYGYAPYRES